MCGAIQGGLSLDGVNLAKEAIIQGQMLRVDAAGHGVPVEVDPVQGGPADLRAAHQGFPSPSSIGTPTSEPYSVQEPS